MYFLENYSYRVLQDHSVVTEVLQDARPVLVLLNLPHRKLEWPCQKL